MWLPEASVSKRRSNEQLVALLEKHRSNPVATSHSIDKPSDSRCGIVEIFIAVLLTVRDFIIQHRKHFWRSSSRVAHTVRREGYRHRNTFPSFFFFSFSSSNLNFSFIETIVEMKSSEWPISCRFFFAIPLTNVHNWRLISDGTLSEEY